MKLKTTFFLFTILLSGTFLISCSVMQSKKTKTLPRIKIKEGKFINSETSEIFIPRGFNYARLRPPTPGSLVHSNFDKKYYNVSKIESMFEDLETNNFNTVRVFLDTIYPLGLFEKDAATRFSPDYMENVIDFLKRATDHNIHVILALDMWGPSTNSWLFKGPVEAPNVSVHNSLYFLPGSADTRAAFLSGITQEIKDRAPELLPTVLTYEIQNELLFFENELPLSMTTGTFEYSGKTYEMSSEKEVQKLMDDTAIKRCNRCVEEVQKVDPEALVSVSVFTFHIVGRKGPTYSRNENKNDQRIPARPIALANSKLSFVDIHLYPFTDEDFQKELDSVDFEKVRKKCLETNKTLLMGEFGFFKNNYPKIDDAVEATKNLAKQSLEKGFGGYIYWTYDTDEQERLWNGKSENGKIIKVLSKIKK